MKKYILIFLMLLTVQASATTPAYSTLCIFQAEVVSAKDITPPERTVKQSLFEFTLKMRTVSSVSRQSFDNETCARLLVNPTLFPARWDAGSFDPYSINNANKNQILTPGSVIEGVINTFTYEISVQALVSGQVVPQLPPTTTYIPPSVPPTVTPSVNIFTRPLKFGMRGNDVKQLQILLNTEGNNLPTTGYFGSATLQAVIRFQNKYASRILTPSGLIRGTGYFGPASIKVANELAYIVF